MINKTKKILTGLALTLLMGVMLAGCAKMGGVTDEQPEELRKGWAEYKADGKEDKVGENHKYEIERAIPDDTFISIIEGETVPKEIIVGFGGENGYEQFSTKDPAMIAEYMNAFRNVTVEEITDKDKMIYVNDGIIDYIFIVDDDTKIIVGTDLTEYITDGNRGIQFHLGNTEKFNDLNKKLWQ